jgi:GT2 family glycosyltransferase
VCICTRNRQEELKNALDSLERSTYPVFEVVVSDDSTSSDTQTLISSCYPNVKYLVGPRRGLGANRNKALTVVTGSHVLFIDDDVILDEHFLETIFSQLENQIIKGTNDINKIILTGIENNNGSLVFPHEQDFLGYQKKEYKEGDVAKTVVINSAVFPINLFKDLCFDEKLVYGCDEVDLTTRAVRKGFRILLCPSAINLHFPSVKNREFYEPYHEASRIYVTFKRYFSTETNILKALVYLGVAFPHTVAHTIRVDGMGGIFKAIRTFRTVLFYVVSEYLTEQKQ